MRIFGGDHPNPVVLENQPVALKLMGAKRTAEPRSRKPLSGKHAVRDADIAEGGLDQFCRLRRSVDVDTLRFRGHTRVLEIVGHQIGEAENVIGMKVSEEYRFDRL